MEQQNRKTHQKPVDCSGALAHHLGPVKLLEAYDKGVRQHLFERFKTALGVSAETANTAVVPSPVSAVIESFRLRAENQGKNVTEFLSLFQTNHHRERSLMHSDIAINGIEVRGSDNELHLIKAIPDTITYEYAFWSVSLEKVEACIQEATFWQHRNPNLIINPSQAPYSISNIPLDLELDLIIGDDLSYCGTWGQQFEKGTVHGYRGSFSLQAWLIESPDLPDDIIEHIIVRFSDPTTGLVQNIEVDETGAKPPAQLIEQKEE